MRDIVSITEKYTELFLEHIKRLADLNRIHHRISKNGGFPVFMIDNREFYEQSYFDQLIENTIWRYLVNGVFHDLFTDEYCISKNIQLEWQYFPVQPTSYVEVIETNCCFVEFIITRNGAREGYRYTNCYKLKEEMQKMFEKKGIDNLYLIDFSSDLQSSFLHPPSIPQGFKGKIHPLPLKDFFCEFFSEEEYEIYSDKVSEAVKEAYQYVGKHTITNLSYQNYPYFLKKVLQEITSFPYATTIYSQTPPRKEPAISWYNSGGFTERDKKIIQKNFFDAERYYALIGNKDFAKSFVTSEYLYQTLTDNNNFDFTAIVTGYLKSIEQLLYFLLDIIEKDGHTNTVWIQSRKSIGSVAPRLKPEFQGISVLRNKKSVFVTQVKIDPKNRKFYDTMFGSLTYMLQSYNNGWAVSSQAKDYISALLLTYCDECRNEHLHKDNIDDPEEVTEIRNKTYLLMYYVLGGYDFTKSTQDEKILLGIIDNRFETLYQKLMQYGQGNYYFLRFESNTPILTALPMQQDTPVYDKNGLLTNGSLRFVKIPRKNLDDWHMDDWGQIEAEDADDRIIIIDRNNIPSSVTYIDKVSGKTIEVKW